MTEGWSPAHGWRTYEAWKRWYRQEWGRLQPTPPQSPSRQLDGVYRVFSVPEGVQAELEVAATEPVRAALTEPLLRQRLRLFLLELQNHIARDPDRWDGAAVVIQVALAVDRRPSLSWGEVAAPSTAPRGPVADLVALALADLGR